MLETVCHLRDLYWLVPLFCFTQEGLHAGAGDSISTLDGCLGQYTHVDSAAHSA